MKRALQSAMWVVLVTASVMYMRAEVVDRLIAIVNNSPVMQSDWEQALRCEALMSGRTPESFSEAEARDVFSRLVDQELIREQMKGFAMAPVTDADVDARMAEIRKDLPRAKTDGGWRQLLARDRLTDAEVQARVKSQLEILRFLDARARPLVRVEYREISQYYRDHYVPELQREGAPPAPLAEVAGQIREIITQQRIDEQTTAWLQTLREGADIRLPQSANDDQVTENKQ